MRSASAGYRWLINAVASDDIRWRLVVSGSGG
jgi:hypothetical protein